MKSEDPTTAKVEGIYYRAQHLARRRSIFERWAGIVINGAKSVG